MAATLGATDYHDGALERLREASVLLREDLLAGSIYLAGRAVESMLRALIWKHDLDVQRGRKSLDTGHDLHEMLSMIGNLGVLRNDKRREKLQENVEFIAQRWSNSMRFFHTGKTKAIWRQFGELSQSTIKMAAERFYNACEDIIRQCTV